MVLRIEVDAVPPINNNTMAIPAMILIVIFFVFIWYRNRKEGFIVSNLVCLSDNASMGNLTVGNMTGGNATGDDTTGSISSTITADGDGDDSESEPP